MISCRVPCSLCSARIQALRLAPSRLGTLLLTVVASPSAYLADPVEERAQYDGDQDTALASLKFADASGGVWGFFAVHGTSLYEVSLFQDDIVFSTHH
jgi:hypothetical protein